MRRQAFKQPAIEPCPVVDVTPEELVKFRNGCPRCGFGKFSEKTDVSMNRVVGLYCSGCNVEFRFV